MFDEEGAYLDLVKKCIETGHVRNDRTGTGTRALFGQSLRFSLANLTLPLLTTKTVPFRLVAQELLFFLRAQTDNKILQEANVHIWDANGSGEFLAQNGIARKEGDLGPIYGFQWRHFGAKYTNCEQDYSGQGVDQLDSVVKSLRQDPNSRRMLVVAWNPEQIAQMALPPCHVLFQFLVSDGKLTCILFQRSGDLGLGIPFNIASYSLLTHMIAKITGLQAHEFVHFIGDAHVYENHVEALKMQLSRRPRKFPQIRFGADGAAKTWRELADFDMSDFVVEGYNPYPKIYMKQAI